MSPGDGAVIIETWQNPLCCCAYDNFKSRKKHGSPSVTKMKEMLMGVMGKKLSDYFLVKLSQFKVFVKLEKACDVPPDTVRNRK